MKKLLFILLMCSAAATAAQSHSATITWSAAASQPTGVVISGYNVYRSTTSGTYGVTPLASTSSTTLTLTDSTVSAGTTYFYVVRSVRPPCTTCSPAETNPVESVNSNEVSAVIPAAPPTAPNPPTNLKATNVF